MSNIRAVVLIFLVGGCSTTENQEQKEENKKQQSTNNEKIIETHNEDQGIAQEKHLPDEIIIEEGVGIKGGLHLCDDASKIVPALGTPTTVKEIDNIWDGKVDDYEYSNSDSWLTPDRLAVRVNKRTNQIIAIGAFSEMNWRTVKGIHKGSTLLDLPRVYGKDPYENISFFSTSYEYNKIGVKFYTGQTAKVLDEQGLPRQTEEIVTVEVRKPKGRKCPLPNSVVFENDYLIYWLRCPLGQKAVGGKCKGGESKFTLKRENAKCPIGYRLPAIEELTELIEGVEDGSGTETKNCINSYRCNKLFGNDVGEYVAFREEDESYWKVSFKNGVTTRLKEGDSVGIRCIQKVEY